MMNNPFTNLPQHKLSRNLFTNPSSISQSQSYQTIQNSNTPLRVKIRPNKNCSSLALQQYQYCLKQQLRFSEAQNQIRKNKRRYKTLQIQNRKNTIQILSELQFIKYRLKNLSLEKQTQLSQKQKLIQLKNSFEISHQSNPFQMQHSSLIPFYNHAKMMQQPCNDQSHGYNKSLEKRKHFSNSQSVDTTPTALSRQKFMIKNKSNNQTEYSTLEASPELFNKTKNKILSKKQQIKSRFNKRLNDLKRFQNKQTIIKKLRKCFLAVYFAVCLKKIYLKIVFQRKKFFLEFWPTEFIKFQQSFQNYFYNSFMPFFKLLKLGQYSSIIPTEEDSKALKIQKNRTIRQILKIFFQCLKHLKEKQNLGKLAWGFCHHGSFAQKGVLTINELQLVSYSIPLGYLRMDSNLQRSQIISFILIKLILYKLVLHPQNKWPKQYDPKQCYFLPSNLKLIASILYDLFVQLQQEYLSQVDTSIYQIGNYTFMKQSNKDFQIQFAKPLLYQTKQPEDQLISGLYSQQFLKKHVSFKKILPDIKLIREVVEGLHKISKSYNQQFISKVLKFIPKVSYKY